MDPPETKKPQTLEQSELAPGTSQSEQQDNPDQDSEFVKIHIELVTHLKHLDAQNEMDEVQGRVAKELFSDYPNSEAGPSSTHLEAGDKQGTTSSGVSIAIATPVSPSDPDQPDSAGDEQVSMRSGVSSPIATFMKSSFDPEHPDSAGLVPNTELKMKKPASIIVIDLNDSPGTGIYIIDTESPRVDIPSNDTKRREIDLNRPYAEGEYEDVSNESADAGNLREVSDDLNRPYAEGEYEGVPNESEDSGNLPEVSDDLNRLYAEGESEDVANDSAEAGNPPEASDEQLIKDEEEQIKILREVLDGTDEDAKDELKSQLIGQSPPQEYHVQKGPLYALCEESLKLLKQYFTKARGPSFWYLGTVQKIMKDAGKLNWLVDVLVEREIAQDFVTIWASQFETSDGYYKFAAEDRHELSRITATLLAGIGERKVYANQEARYSLLKTWLLPLCDDIGRRYEWSGIDLELIEYGLVGTVFSLPEPMQHEILSDWVHKRPNSGNNWPPLLAWYELWWSKPFK